MTGPEQPQKASENIEDLEPSESDEVRGGRPKPVNPRPPMPGRGPIVAP